jgi:arylsulfatase A-like enzyme
MHRFFFPWLVSHSLSLAASFPSKPNILLILADDQGYGEFACHGNPILKTPALDQLAEESVRLGDFHAYPMCTPTRAALLSGCDALRTKAVNVSSGRTLLKKDLKLLPETLLELGYETGLFGKWHLGDNYPYRPQDRGFQETVTFGSSHIGSVSDAWENDYFDDTYLHNGKAEAYQGYTTDVFFQEAMEWMKSQRQAGKPFFAYLPTAAPHSPYFVPQKYRDTVEPRLAKAEAAGLKLAPEKRKDLLSYLAMIENLDENMARLERFLTETRLKENTLCIYLSDNGTTLGDIYFPAGMRGKKVTLWEGGHRVPCFLRWPAGGLVANELPGLAQVQDLMPTALELAGLPLPSGLDGMSLAKPVRNQASISAERALFINYSRMPTGEHTPELKKDGTAVLWKHWRLLEGKQLYDLRSDPLQEKDVALGHPAIKEQLSEKLDAWWQSLGTGINTPERVDIDFTKERPCQLTACEWWDVFVDQQSQIRRGERKNGTWHVDFAKGGNYTFRLRRWPVESGLAISDGKASTKVTDGFLGPCVAIPIASARFECGGQRELKAVAKTDTYVDFQKRVEKGPAELRATFLDQTGAELLGAYYLEVRP